LEKQKQRPAYTQPPELGHAEPPLKHEMYHDGAAENEMPSTGIAEVLHRERPAELAAHMPDNARRHS
jgi:hypothetical protein